MASTARGYPYPVGTDRVMDGDDAIKALAQAVNDKLGGPTVTGEVPIAIVASGGSASTAVTFPAGRFATAPYVFCQVNNGRLSSSPGSVTATGFVYQTSNFSGGATASAAIGYWSATMPIS
jgi:hypothetical protein